MSKLLPELAHGLFGTLYADKGDISKKLTLTLKELGVK
ncbi:transposase [Mycoavidus sp. SF9855]|nr:transposase [Mycoavidus sp. SF9855]